AARLEGVRLDRARLDGARLVLIDPVHHKTASLCEAYVQPAPGGDFALAMAVAHEIFARGWCDPEAASYCDHLEAFESLARSRTVGAWCALADVPVTAAEDLARRLAREGPTAILVGWGMGRRLNGSAIVRAIDALAAISGNLGVPGGGVSFYFKRRRAFDTHWTEPSAPPPRTVCEPLFGREVLTLRDPPVRAVWITAGNPVAMLPESNTTVRALESREFVVVVDSFLTDTARLAHLVLPAVTLLESDDLVGAYGHHFLGVSRPVVDRPAEVRSDLEIMQGLAALVGLTDVMAGTAREWKQRFVAGKLAARGVTLEDLERGPVRNPLAARVLYADRRFPTATGRVNLMHEAPAHLRSPRDGEFPLTLLSLSTEKSQSSQWPRAPEGPATCTVHPDASGGIAHGALAKLESCIASVTVRVLHDPAQRRDVAIVPKGGHLRAGRCANALVRAQLTDDGEGGALYDEPVRLRPVER
ncbi:MAG: molybdopterin-dependent oxidoreductase, partial [Deltaproteobacteria bacterium]